VDRVGHSVLAGPAHPGSNDRTLVLPLRPGLSRGAYTVRWRVVSNDGHLIEGVLAFGVGTGLAKPVPTLQAGGSGPSFASVVLRLLFLVGVVLGGGAALAGRVLLEPGRTRLETSLVGVGLLLVAGGGFGLLALEPAADATRFGRVTETAAIVAVVGVAAALASVILPPLRYALLGCALLELAAPTLAGHALDPRRLRALVGLADFVHVAAAGFWIGGLALLTLSRSPRARRRFPRLALAAVAVLGAASIPRAIAALPSFSAVVDTGYGQAVLVKTGLAACVLGLAWVNGSRLRDRGLAGELAVLLVVIGTVAVLTDLRPPARASAAAQVAPGRVSPPPADAVVVAGEDDDVAVGLAASPQGRRVALRVTALGPDGLGLDGFDARIAGRPATPCGNGCYAATVSLPPPPRRITVSLSGLGRRPVTLPFTLPARWPAPPARALVTRTDRVFRALRTLVIHERLGSNARNAIRTTYRVQAPNRLAYRIAGGPQAVIIGGTRWDRLPGGRWERSEQEPLRQPEPFWGSDPVRNARLLGAGRVGGRPVWLASFYDPRLPAWFELSIDRRTSRLLALRMTAQAHFMRHRYSGFDSPLHIVPPSSTPR
jgi:putative copper export protein